VEHKLDKLIIEKLGLSAAGALQIDDWQELMHKIRHPKQEVTIAVVGKYIEHIDAYKSIYESLTHAGFFHSARVLVKRIEAEDMQKQDPAILLGGADGILVPGGFGMRGIEGKIEAVRYAREHKVPYFGICLGMQVAVIEYARQVLGLPKANSTEFDANTPNPVICILEEQKAVTHKGGTMRLGAQPCVLEDDSIAAKCYETQEIRERHRHRYEFNPDYRSQFIEKGLLPTGTSPNGKLVEIIEIPNHPWFLAVQFHPEFKSKPHAPHPLFKGFIEAALKARKQRLREDG
jgi:CTP synthase